jgi:enamine deaminase RidA (YjgF/YER057c/UK114 family)
MFRDNAALAKLPEEEKTSGILKNGEGNPVIKIEDENNEMITAFSSALHAKLDEVKEKLKTQVFLHETQDLKNDYDKMLSDHIKNLNVSAGELIKDFQNYKLRIPKEKALEFNEAMKAMKEDIEAMGTETKEQVAEGLERAIRKISYWNILMKKDMAK